MAAAPSSAAAAGVALPDVTDLTHDEALSPGREEVVDQQNSSVLRGRGAGLTADTNAEHSTHHSPSRSRSRSRSRNRNRNRNQQHRSAEEHSDGNSLHLRPPRPRHSAEFRMRTSGPHTPRPGRPPTGDSTPFPTSMATRSIHGSSGGTASTVEPTNSGSPNSSAAAATSSSPPSARPAAAAAAAPTAASRTSGASTSATQASNSDSALGQLENMLILLQSSARRLAVAESNLDLLLCSVCMAQHRTVLLQPCNHVPVCTSCYEQIKQGTAQPKCPICRTVVAATINQIKL